MPERRPLLISRLLAVPILANFIAQVPYYLHRLHPGEPLIVPPRSTFELAAVLALFIAGYALFEKGRGRLILALFLALDFGFYLWNLIGGVRHGYGWFFHLSEPDRVYWWVFAIGYLNFFAAGAMLALLGWSDFPSHEVGRDRPRSGQGGLPRR